MKRINVTLLLVIVIAAPVVSGQKKKLPRTKAKTSTAQVKDEAHDEAVKAWDKYITKCEGSYYMRPCCDGNGPICEYRFVSISIEETPLNEADKLNGIERNIASYFNWKAGRCQSDGGWGEWGTGGRMSMRLIKKSGIWTASNPTYAIWGINNSKIACSDVSSYNKRLGLNMDSYCKSKHGDSAVAVYIARNDAYSWRCMTDDGKGDRRLFEMNMDEACQGQYGSEYKAVVDNLKDFASWHCIPK